MRIESKVSNTNHISIHIEKNTDSESLLNIITSGGVPPFRYTAKNSPYGTFVCYRTGVIKGKITRREKNIMNVRVEDSTGATASASISYEVTEKDFSEGIKC